MRYYPTIGSTNHLAARWAEAGARDLSLVVADEQSAGRGRMGRRWLTPAGSALAFTLVLRQDKEALATHLAQVTALGALAACDTINAALPAVTPAQVKWPNDVVASRRKLAVRRRAHWRGDELMALILESASMLHLPLCPRRRRWISRRPAWRRSWEPAWIAGSCCTRC